MLTIIEAKNPVYTQSGINVEVLFGEIGEWLCFHASPDDSEEHGRTLYQRAIDGDFGPVRAYETPVLTKEQLIPIARADRNAAENSDIEVFGVLWQVDAVARDRMRATIETAAATSAPPETLVNWILSDNTIRPSTTGDLQQVLIAYTMRLADIFQQYVAWMNSSSTEMFSYVG